MSRRRLPIQEPGSDGRLNDQGGGYAGAAIAGVTPPASHTHPESDITGLVSDLAGKAAAVHVHAISDTTGLQTALDGKAATGHTHAISDTTGLQTALDGKAATGHTHAGTYEPVLGNPASNGQVLASTTGGSRSWVSTMTNPMTTSGDLLYGGASGVPTRLAKGTDGQVLTLASGIPTWGAASASGVTSFNTRNGAVTLTTADVTGVLSGQSLSVGALTATGQVNAQAGIRQTGGYIARFENTWSDVPSGAAGNGVELGVISGVPTIGAVDRTNALILGMRFLATSYDMTGGPVSMGALTATSVSNAVTNNNLNTVTPMYECSAFSSVRTGLYTTNDAVSPYGWGLLLRTYVANVGVVDALKISGSGGAATFYGAVSTGALTATRAILNSGDFLSWGGSYTTKPSIYADAASIALYPSGSNSAYVLRVTAAGSSEFTGAVSMGALTATVANLSSAVGNDLLRFQESGVTKWVMYAPTTGKLAWWNGATGTTLTLDGATNGATFAGPVSMGALTATSARMLAGGSLYLNRPDNGFAASLSFAADNVADLSSGLRVAGALTVAQMDLTGGRARIAYADAAMWLVGSKAGGNWWSLQTVDADGRLRINDVTNSREVFAISQTGAATFAGDLNISSGAANANLNLKNTAGPTGFTLQLDSVGAAYIWQRENKAMYFGTNGTTALTIAANQAATFAGSVTGITEATNDNSTKFATTAWVRNQGYGAAGSASWGNITGTLASQTDLSNALAGKSDTGHNHSGTYATVSHNQAWSTITSTPTTLAGYGITDAASSTHNHSGTYSTVGHDHAGVYEPVITAGTTSQWWRGDKTWQTISQFPGFGTTNSTAAYGDHNHSGVYEPAITTGAYNKVWFGNKSWGFVDWGDLTGKPSTFTPSTHSHAIADVTGLTSALAGKSDTTHTHTSFVSLSLSGTLSVNGTASDPSSIYFNGIYSADGFGTFGSVLVGNNLKCVGIPKVGMTNTGGTLSGGYDVIHSGNIGSQTVSQATWAGNGCPVGTVMMYVGTTAPTGWTFCDGRELGRGAYAALFDVIGTTYGVGNGSTTFNVPDFMARSPIGNSFGNQITDTAGNLKTVALGDRFGEFSHALNISELPSHNHTSGFTTNGTASNGSYVGGQNGTSGTGYTGGNQAHNTVHPVMGINFIIRHTI